MKYSKGLLLYEDEPVYGFFLRLISIVLPAGLLVLSGYLSSAGEKEGALVLLLEAFIVGAIFFVVFPRKYQVYEDHLRIVLGGPFYIRIVFDKIRHISVTDRLVFSVNFATRLTGKYVEIAQKRSWSVAITPRNNEAFVENANRALNDWLKTSNS